MTIYVALFMIWVGYMIGLAGKWLAEQRHYR